MDTREFHRIFWQHLNSKGNDVARIIALETNNEKWFQGEMALAFSKRGYRIFSSECYNKCCDTISWDEWNKLVGNEGILTCEAGNYRKIKNSPNKASSVRKADFFLEDRSTFVFAELKQLWIGLGNNDLGKYLLNKGIFEDAWRLKQNLYSEYNRKKTYAYLSLIAIVSNSSNVTRNEIQETVASSIKDYFNLYKEEIELSKDTILMDQIVVSNDCLSILSPNWTDNKPIFQCGIQYNMYLITVPIVE